MTDLCVLAAKYGTDKLGEYTRFYHSLFANVGFPKLLELGIGVPKVMTHVPDYQPGASLKMWRDYFYLSQIYGADIEPEAMLDNEPRIKTVLADERNRADLLKLARLDGGNFGVIIDDASHDPEDQAYAFKTLSTGLAKDGYYIIEDVAEPKRLTELLGVPHAIVSFGPIYKSGRKDCLCLIRGWDI